MKRLTLFTLITLTACNNHDETETQEVGVGTADVDSNDESGGQTSVGTGSTGDSSSTVSSSTAGDSSDDTGDGDGDEGGDGDGDASSSSVSAGDGDVGDGDGDESSTDTGTMTFPGEPCDPFNDDCLEGYFCHTDDFITLDNPEFRCREFIPMGTSTGEYGQKCAESSDCVGGLMCSPWQAFPDGDCDTSTPGDSCCLDRCVFDEVCENGSTCTVYWFPPELEDYLDSYGGIGVCALI